MFSFIIIIFFKETDNPEESYAIDQRTFLKLFKWHIKIKRECPTRHIMKILYVSLVVICTCCIVFVRLCVFFIP